MVKLKHFEAAIQFKEQALAEKQEAIINRKLQLDEEVRLLKEAAPNLTVSGYKEREMYITSIGNQLKKDITDVTKGYELLEKEKELFVTAFAQEANKKK